MNFKAKVLDYAKISPVILLNGNLTDFENAIVLESTISSKNLGIVNTEKGLKAPKWIVEAKNQKEPLIVINNLDYIDKYNQKKFYELLKYKAISNIELPVNTRIIILANDLEKISPNIINLCVVYK